MKDFLIPVLKQIVAYFLAIFKQFNVNAILKNIAKLY
jgi:hypothetical protein